MGNGGAPRSQGGGQQQCSHDLVINKRRKCTQVTLLGSCRGWPDRPRKEGDLCFGACSGKSEHDC